MTKTKKAETLGQANLELLRAIRDGEINHLDQISDKRRLRPLTRLETVSITPTGKISARKAAENYLNQ